MPKLLVTKNASRKQRRFGSPTRFLLGRLVLQPRIEKENKEIVAIDDIGSRGHQVEKTQGQMPVPRIGTGERVRVRTRSMSEKSAHRERS